MTYQFFCKYVNPKLAVWLTALWFGILLVAIFVFSAFGEDVFVYKNF